MKKILAFLMCFWLINTAQAQFQHPGGGVYAYDNAEQYPLFSWGMDFRDGYAMPTGGSQNPPTTDPRAYVVVSTDYARKGTKSYKMYVEKDFSYPGQSENGTLRYVRSEWTWMTPDQQTQANEWRWAAISILVDPSVQFHNIRYTIGYDLKESPDDLQNPFGLLIQNGRYWISGRMINGVIDMGPVVKGVWVDWLMDRNWKCDGTGYIKFYKNGVLMHTETGPNRDCRAVANNGQVPSYQNRIQHGIYIWAWQDANWQGEGPPDNVAAANSPITIYMDEIRFGDPSATIDKFIVDGTPPTNQPPTANAGANQSITLPTSTASFTGSGNDPDGTIETIQWTKLSGPAGGTINAGTTYNMNVTGLTNSGSYVYRLTVTDDEGATALDDVTLAVNPSTPPPTEAPIFTDNSCSMEIGYLNCPVVPTPDQTIQLPVTGDTVIPIAVHQNDGYVQQFAMVQLSGPNSSSINQFNQFGWIPSGTNFGVTGMIEGVYSFKITVTDNEGTPVLDTMTITVVAATNDPPTVNAGSNQTIVWPNGIATLSGSASDDGSVASVQWTKITGPTGGTFNPASTAATSFTPGSPGLYLLRLTAIDNQAASAFDEVTVTVNYVNAGLDTTIVNTATTATLRGTLTGTGTVAWTQLSGPNTATISAPTTLTSGITGLVSGAYGFRITATYTGSGTVATDDVQVTVLPGNVLPTVNAGTDITLALDGFGSPTTQSTTLRGTDSDGDGTIATATWSIVSGPAGSVFGTPTNDTTTFTNLIGGTYVARLTVVDNDGGSSFDDISVRVITVSAGADQGLPSTTTSVTLTAISNSVSDTTDVIWTKISGTGGTITSSGVLSTTVTGLTIGAYVFQVQVTHVGGFVTKDQVAINISATESNNFYKLQRGVGKINTNKENYKPLKPLPDAGFIVNYSNIKLHKMNDLNSLKPIPGYDKYFADREGNVYSDKYGRMKLMTPVIDRHGYKRLCMFYNRKQVSRSLHRLIALTFIGESDLVVNHKNGIKTDNRPENLEWVTVGDNTRHGVKTGLIVSPRGEDHGNAKLKEMDVIATRLWLDNKLATQEELAQKMGVNRVSLSNIYTRKAWRHI